MPKILCPVCSNPVKGMTKDGVLYMYCAVCDPECLDGDAMTPTGQTVPVQLDRETCREVDRKKAKDGAIAARGVAHRNARSSHKDGCVCKVCSHNGLTPCSPANRCLQCRRDEAQPPELTP